MPFILWKFGGLFFLPKTLDNPLKKGYNEKWSIFAPNHVKNKII